jgi:hypothetical protein
MMLVSLSPAGFPPMSVSLLNYGKDSPLIIPEADFPLIEGKYED